VRLWDPATGDTRATLTAHHGPVRAVAFSPDGTTLASAGASINRTVRLWDPATGDTRATLTGPHGPVQAVAFSPDGTTLASAGHDGTVRLWDPATGDTRATLTAHHGPVRAVAFSPDGASVASAAPTAPCGCGTLSPARASRVSYSARHQPLSPGRGGGWR
jgi:WD40 repeat protein